jgi:phospholipid N-methyltransferase
MQYLSATYSPEDNKLRLYSTSRLDKELYERVRAAGFIFAAKQDCFVAPMWTPNRADLAIELCGEIGDEDMTLVERAEMRAERFEGYRDNRTQDAQNARRAVEAITEHIPFGQPILVGHHSERHARKDAERIERGMTKAVQMWETAEYWKTRAKGALRHAKYKEQPAVRHRRIKGLEADKRKHQREIDDAHKFTKLWQLPNLTLERAQKITNFDYVVLSGEGYGSYGSSVYSLLTDGKITPALAAEKCLEKHARTIEVASRWIAHIDNRLAYEHEMLEESGGVAAQKFDIQIGGRVLTNRRDGEWLVVLRVNRANGKINSVTTTAPASVHWAKNWKYAFEEITDYRAPEAEEAAKAKEATKLAPMVNFPGEGFLEMTLDEYKRKPNDYKSTRKAKATETHGAYRYRSAFVPGGSYKIAQVFITDAKRVDPPAASAPAITFEREHAPVKLEAKAQPVPAEANDFELMRETLRQGVQVISAPQLFPTPASTAARMVEEASIKDGDTVGEFSAGTGRIIAAIYKTIDRSKIELTAVEINLPLSRSLATAYSSIKVVHADFLECGDELGLFDRIIINPPFAQGQDIAHIKHAVTFLKPGGRLVAICANGPRQNAELLPLVESFGGTWEPLPEGTFNQSGTNVNTVLLTLDR